LAERVARLRLARASQWIKRRKASIDFTGLSFAGNTTPTTQLVKGKTVLTVTEGADAVSVTSLATIPPIIS
jgi:hypothetical protein